MNDSIESNDQVCSGCGYPAYAGHSSNCPTVHQPRENSILNLVLEHTTNFEELNAADLQEGEQKFASALVKALKQQEAEEKPLGIGSQSLVQRLKEAKRVVVKRLMFGKKLRGQGELSPEGYFEQKKQEYNLVRKYFGSDFTPHTDFAQVNTNFNSPHPDTIPGHEYIMVQEELSGEDVSFQGGSEYNFENSKISSKLKQNLVAFVKRYKEMQTGSKVVVEDQIRVDFDKGEVFIQDTDFLQSYENFTKGNSFLEYIGKGNADVDDVTVLIKLLGENVPGFEDLTSMRDTDLTAAIPLKETNNFVDAMQWLQKKLRAEGKNIDEIKQIQEGFSKLITAIDYFPPAGDNSFIKSLNSAFHLKE